MAKTADVLEYKCPCCGAGLFFGNQIQKMKCQYCDNEFDLDTVREFSQDLDEDAPEATVEADTRDWTEDEQDHLQRFVCPSCAGEIITDANTVATFCPYCGNPSVISQRVTGGLKPDGVIPFKKSRDDAKAAFLKFCKGKVLLPKLFTQEQRLEKITGLYVPFWLYDCRGDLRGRYRATRVRVWSDRDFTYTKTSHYLLTRESDAEFSGIPMDGSEKMEDALMESIEPFDYHDMVDFDTAYLSGYLADKYDVPAQAGQERIRQRVERSMDELLQDTFLGFNSVVPAGKQVHVQQSRARYVLLPVWILNTSYRGKMYTFAMNGQTGKLTGTLPICPKRSWAWFGGITAVAGVITFLVTHLL